MLAPGSTPTLLPGQLAHQAGERVRDALAELGRTEDVRFSPDGRRLAIACYARNEVAVVDVETRREAAGSVSITLRDVTFHDAPSLAEPHGLDFADDETLVVASRGGELTVLALPQADAPATARTRGSIACELGAAGSVAARPLSSGETELLVVHNWANALARYRLTRDGSLGEGVVVAERWLELPDGLALSARGDWLAVSNHDSHDVLVFELATLHPAAAPVGVLRGVMYPHGLRFAHDDRLLLVADAGAPHVNVFRRPGETWAGVSYPALALPVMDEDTFAAGRHNPMEGGPKGLDVEPRTNVLVVTAEQAPVAFFDLELALETAARPPTEDLVRYELARLERLARTREEADEARRQLRAVLETKAWRLTSPLRGAYGVLRRRG